MRKKQSVHEADAPLMSAEDAIEDAACLAVMIEIRQQEITRTFPQPVLNLSRDEILAAIREGRECA